MTSKDSEEAYEQDWYNSLKAFAAKAAQSAEAEEEPDTEEPDAEPVSAFVPPPAADTIIEEAPGDRGDTISEITPAEPEPFERPSYVVDDPGTMASLEAIDAIAQIGGPGAVDQLVACLVDEEAIVRTLCIELLGHLGDRRATDAIQGMLDDPDPGVAAMARATLERLKTSA